MIHDIHIIHRAGRPFSAGATRGHMRPSTRARETGSEGNRRARNPEDSRSGTRKRSLRRPWNREAKDRRRKRWRWQTSRKV